MLYVARKKGTFFNVVRSLEQEDFLQNVHVLSCFIQLKSVLFNLLCVLDKLFCIVVVVVVFPAMPGKWEDRDQDEALPKLLLRQPWFQRV